MNDLIMPPTIQDFSPKMTSEFSQSRMTWVNFNVVIYWVAWQSELNKQFVDIPLLKIKMDKKIISFRGTTENVVRINRYKTSGLWNFYRTINPWYLAPRWVPYAISQIRWETFIPMRYGHTRLIHQLWFTQSTNSQSCLIKEW